MSLALSGLAVAAGDPARAAEAVQAFAQTPADTRRLLDVITAHDRSGLLAELHAPRDQ